MTRRSTLLWTLQHSAVCARRPQIPQPIYLLRLDSPNTKIYLQLQCVPKIRKRQPSTFRRFSSTMLYTSGRWTKVQKMQHTRTSTPILTLSFPPPYSFLVLVLFYNLTLHAAWTRSGDAGVLSWNHDVSPASARAA